VVYTQDPLNPGYGTAWFIFLYLTVQCSHTGAQTLEGFIAAQ